jgi:hypothetical protein
MFLASTHLELMIIYEVMIRRPINSKKW